MVNRSVDKQNDVFTPNKRMKWYLPPQQGDFGDIVQGERRQAHKWPLILWSRLHKVCTEQVNPWTKQTSGWLGLERSGGAREAADRDETNIVWEVGSGDRCTAQNA